jgi:hypothetical protein
MKVIIYFLLAECFTDHYRVSRHGVDSVRRPSCFARLWDIIVTCPNVTIHITGPSSINNITDRYQFECVEELIASLAKFFFASTATNTNRHNFSVNDRKAIHEWRWTGRQKHNATASTIRTTII